MIEQEIHGHIVNLLLQPHNHIQSEHLQNKLTHKKNSRFVTIGHPIYGPLPKNFEIQFQT